jgi:pSer/pThr/pTyr-binding forkhead associated (FHA) protein
MAIDSSKECHLLKIDDERGSRTLTLDAATYSLGRDQTNAIILASKHISRKQALLLRMPKGQPHCYSFRLMDGDSSGKPSKNGVMVNGRPCKSRDLESGDVIVFANTVKVVYQVLPMTQASFLKYMRFDEVDFHSIKTKAVNTVVTLPVGTEFVKPEQNWLADFGNDEPTKLLH